MAAEAKHSTYSALSESSMFRDFREAFRKAMGLPLSIHPPSDGQERGFTHKPFGLSLFCARIAQTNHTGTACLEFQKRLEEGAKLEPKTLKCFAGLCETAVPVRVDERLVAFLQTGGVLVKISGRRQLNKVTRDLLRLGTPIERRKFEKRYYAARVLAPEQYASMIRVLEMFASQLGACGHQMVLQRTAPETSAISHVRQIIDAGFREELSLGAVAQKAKVSAGYLSGIFKKSTGLNFVDYVAHRRVEAARSLLEDRKFRVSDVAFEVGFQSLSQFNRSFHRIAGMSPRASRV